MTNIARETLFEAASRILDATAVLNAAYKEVTSLFNVYDLVHSVVDKEKIVEKICATLLVNMQIEEEIFYPAVKKALKEKAIYSAAIMNHTVLKYLISELKNLDADSSVYDIKVKVLRDHVKQDIWEKQSRIFPKINASGKLDLWDLGLQLVQRRESLSF